MSRMKQTLAALSLATCLVVPATFSTAQAVVISPDQVAAVIAACGDGGNGDGTSVDGGNAACLAAIDAALDAALAAFPGTPPEAVIGALAAELAAVSNAALAAGTQVDLAAIAAALAGLSSYAAGTFGLTSLAATIAGMSGAVAAGETVDVTAIASGAPDTAPDMPASAT